MYSFFLTLNGVSKNLRLLYQKHRVKKFSSTFIYSAPKTRGWTEPYVNFRSFFRIVAKSFSDFRGMKKLSYFPAFHRSEFLYRKKWNTDIFDKMPKYEKNLSSYFVIKSAKNGVLSSKKDIVKLFLNQFVLLLMYAVFLILLPIFSVGSQELNEIKGSRNQKPEKLKGSINTNLNEFGISLTDSGNVLYFYSKRENSIYTDLYKSTRVGDKWQQGEEIENLNSNYDDQSPFILNQEEGIIFSSNRDGSIEFQLSNGKIGVSRDLYFSKKIDSSWIKPMALPRTVNTEEIEENPFLFDNRLYFTRYPFGQVSEADIFVSVYRNKTWEKATSLPGPINTAYSEIAATISRDGKTIYFSSNRPGGFGGYDLYKSTLLANGDFSEPINLGPDINTAGDEAFYLEAADGSTFYFCRRSGHDYDVYSIVSNPFQELEKGKSISLDSIHFALGSYEILEDSFPILENLNSYLRENPDIKIRIIGHTDLNGDYQDNIILSHNRANAVKDYLVRKGIDSGRIVTDGKGSSEPIIPRKDPKTDYKNRRTEFQIISP
ncbi:OmpA family protein [Leptospira borgpetersenii]|uniref:OmpA family protein n=1 Tax=Leptospira borgpetersenii TaxID=174 RepID=UPI000774B2B3|nr:OmpA family protein [Leptospira borgpetersenii]MBE8400008.1 OmpA family protein [Leptospira borgpetersenii serovar Tarassovi]MBE8403242.1 OmpA family protein [Leptospira borgpetersenii serovar Tarassovi]MBE8407165.1 OmpA family protein [Leptospira borgpetersenii serovar Tarassovi]MBE8412509.1 OmpA family protein [Leptospira borgpetersenii serovar Tarassovi]MBE8416477.1 OmpA family protein [Leptospira borgpetersenii serovar Tarassovi]